MTIKEKIEKIETKYENKAEKLQEQFDNEIETKIEKLQEKIDNENLKDNPNYEKIDELEYELDELENLSLSDIINSII